MNTTTSNSPLEEGAAFEIPQLDAPPPTEHASASAAGSPGASEGPRRSMAASLSKSFTELQTRLAKAEARALNAEEQLAAHQQHCICRAGAVAAAIAGEAVDSDASPRAASR